MARIVLPNNWRPRDYQLPAWTYLENGGRHAELVWARRHGKDEIALHRTACAAFERTANYWHMLPEAAQARKAIWGAVNPHTGLKRIDEAFPLELRSSTNNTEMLITFKNGSTWQVVGSDNFNSLVGSAPAGIVYSEWALANPNARAYLRPILAENNGWQVFITTPRGRNHAYQTLQAAQKLMRNGGDAFAQIIDATESGVFSAERLASELIAYIAEFGEDYGRAKFEQEFMCSFDAANLGAILARAIGVAEKDGRVTDAVEFDSYGAPLDITADIGRRDTATWWFWQPKIGGYSVVDYDGGWGIDAEEWCARLQERICKYQRAGHRTALGTIWLPHDARAKTFAAKRSAVEIFVEAFGADHVAITPNSRIPDRVNAARVLMPRIEFHETNCEKGLNGLRSWSYAYNEETKIFSSEPVHDWASHDGDGFSYGCLVMQQTAPPPPPPDKMRGLVVGQPTVSLDELFASTPKTRQQRY
jgi:phage terminase large subunit